MDSATLDGFAKTATKIAEIAMNNINTVNINSEQVINKSIINIDKTFWIGNYCIEIKIR